MNSKTQEIIKRILLDNTGIISETLPLACNVTRKELNYIINWYNVEEDCEQFNINDNYPEDETIISPFIFKLVIIQIENSINRLLNDGVL